MAFALFSGEIPAPRVRCPTGSSMSGQNHRRGALVSSHMMRQFPGKAVIYEIWLPQLHVSGCLQGSGGADLGRNFRKK